MLEPLPEAVEVGEVDGLPEPAEPAVADPAADGQDPPHHHDCSHPMDPPVLAPGAQREAEEGRGVLKRAGSCQAKTQGVSSGECSLEPK